MSNRLYLEEEDDIVLDEDTTSTRLYLDEEDDESPELQDTSTRLYLEPEEDDILPDTMAAAPAASSIIQPTLQAPAGYEYKETPTFDDKGDPIVKRELVEIGAEPAPKPPEPDFTYEETSAAFSQAGRNLLDTLTLYDRDLHNVFGEEFTVTQVPEYLRPFVRITGKTVDGIIVQPFIDTTYEASDTLLSGGKAGLMFLKETAEGFGSAITRAVQDNITSESDAINTIKSMPGLSGGITLGLIQEAAKVAGVEGKDIFPFTPKTGGEMFARDLAMMAEVEAGLPITTAVRTAKGINAPLDETVGAANRHAQRREELANRRIRVDEAKENAARLAAERKAEAAKIIRDRAKEADEVARDAIDEVEQNLLNGASIHRETKSGRIALDFDKSAELGRNKVDDLLDEAAEEGLDATQEIVGTQSKILHPILDPDKFEPVVAVLVELKDKFPTAFKKQKHLEGPFKGQKVTFGQQLLKLVVDADEQVVRELGEVYQKYGLNAADLANMTIAGDRRAAQILREKRTILERLRGADNRATPAGKVDDMQTKQQKDFDEAVESMGTVAKNIKRVENIFLGALTGTIATAMRNLESYIIRSPQEGLITAMETAVIEVAKKRKARMDAKKVGPPEPPVKMTEEQMAIAANRNPFATDLEAISNVFNVTNGNPKQMQELIDYIFMDDSLQKFYQKLYGNLDELGIAMGRGEGRFGDTVLSGLEDLVQVLNAPNRWQEFHIRNGTFLGKIQSELQREWGIDFIEAINKGRIKDIINDAPNIKPKGAKSFNTIMADATEDALEATYASSPKTKFGASVTRFVRTTPFMSLVVAFPRFMFKAMEYLGQSSVGIPLVYGRRLVSGGYKYPTDRKIIQRNIAGIAGIGAATMYRMSEDAPADYTKVYSPSGNEIDTKPLIPLPQALWYGEAIAQGIKPDGDFSDFWSGGGGRDFGQLFTGTNFKAGQTLGPLAKGLVDTVGSEQSRLSEKRAETYIGELIGSAAFRPFRPLVQAIDLERGLGGRPLEYRTFASDPVLYDASNLKTTIKSLSAGFLKGSGKQFRRQGLTTSAQEEAALPFKVTPFRDEPKARVQPLLKLFGGITMTTPNSDVQDWLLRHNFRQQYLFEGRTGIDTIDDAITETFNAMAIPIVKSVMETEEAAMAEATTAEEKRKAYINARDSVKLFLKDVKQNIGDIKYRQAEESEDGIRSVGTFNPAFVKALLRARRLSSEGLSQGISRYKDAMGMKPGEQLNFNDIEVLSGIAKAGELWMSSNREALNNALQGLN